MIKFKPHRTGPPAGSWRRLCQGLAIDVVGLSYRRPNALEFIRAGERLHLNNREYGVRARREPNNPHSRKGYATAIDGWWTEAGFFGGQRSREIHLGYLPEWASEEALDGRAPEPRIFAELYSAFRGDTDYVDIEVIVHVERTPSEIEAMALEQEERAADKLFTRALSRSLKILARVATADSGACGNEREQIAAFVREQHASAGRLIDEAAVQALVAEAVDDQPSHNAALGAARKLAEEGDIDTLRTALEASFRLARADGIEAQEEIAALKSIVASVRRKIDKGS